MVNPPPASPYAHTSVQGQLKHIGAGSVPPRTCSNVVNLPDPHGDAFPACVEKLLICLLVSRLDTKAKLVYVVWCGLR